MSMHPMEQKGLSFSSLDPMLRPTSIAVVGASDDPLRIGGRPIAYMLRNGFQGRIYPVNPKRDTVQGLRAYPRVADLPEPPDAAVVAVPAVAAPGVVADLASRGCRSAIVFTSGFAEAGAAGAAAQAAMADTARRSGMRLLGPNTIGAFNAPLGYFPLFSASLENGWPISGRVGIASQSGALGTHLFVAARARGIGVPLLITTGNEADVTLADAIGWLAEAPEVDVIASYAEGFRDGPRLIAAFDRARACRKPVVMLKAGRSLLGNTAARSHTAAVTGDDAVLQAVLDEFAVHRAATCEELLDVAYAASRRIYPATNTLGVLTISGGGGIVIADAAEAKGLVLPPLPEPTQARLKALVPFCAATNPVDCTGQAFADLSLVDAFLEALAEDERLGALLVFFSQVGGAPTVADRLRAKLQAFKARHPTRLWTVSILGTPELTQAYEAEGFLMFPDPSRAVTALAACARFGAAFAEEAQPSLPSVTQTKLPTTEPNEAEAKQLLAQAGLPVVSEFACADASAAVAAADSLGYPVVLKILSPDILHKSEVGGVLLGVADADGVRSGFHLLLERAAANAPGARIDGVLVARQLRGGLEMVIGVVRDPVFGPIAMAGLGGLFVEVLKDVAFHRCPFDAATAEHMIRRLKAAPLLDGVRGRPRADIGALAEALARLSVFAAAAGPRLKGVEVNPMLVLAEGEGCCAVDAVLELEDA